MPFHNLPYRKTNPLLKKKRKCGILMVERETREAATLLMCSKASIEASRH